MTLPVTLWICHKCGYEGHSDYMWFICPRCRNSPSKLSQSNEKGLQALRIYLYRLFGNRCFLCHKSRFEESLSFHHTYYSGHYKNILFEVILYPLRFLLLCKSCHYSKVHFRGKPDFIK